MFERGFYCYKWVKDGEIVYIGKTVTPKLRIAQERKVEKFQLLAISHQLLAIIDLRKHAGRVGSLNF